MEKIEYDIRRLENHQQRYAKMRQSGIDIIGEVPWGTHFCQFYQTQEDLLDILIPYFNQGLLNNEYCMWITSIPLQQEQALTMLRQVVPDLDVRIAKGQIEILDYSQWYVIGGKFDADRVLNGWIERESHAIQKGYAGLRLTGNTFWLEEQDWNDFADYEAKVNEIIGAHQMIALCTYSLDHCSPIELLDVVKNHQFALAKRNNTWEILESAENKKLEGRYRGLVNSIDAGYIHCQILLDEAGHPVDFIFKDINPAYEQMRNRRRPEVIGKRVTELFPSIVNDPFNWIEKYGRVAQTGEPYQFEQYSQATNSYVSGYVYCPERGYFDVLFVDITKRKKAEKSLQESEEKLRNIIQSAPIGIHIWEMNQNGQLVFTGANPAADSILGFNHKSILGKTIVEGFPAHASTNVPAIYTQIAKNGGSWSEDQYLYKDNKISGVFEVRAFQATPGRTIAMFSDITGRLHAQETLRLKNLELERSNNDLEAFAFAASHDLQEPIRMVTNFVQLLENRYRGKIDAEADQYILQVVESTTQMRNLIQALLNYSRIQTREKSFETINMSEILKHALSGLSIAIKESGAIITYDPLPQLQGDPIQLGQVLQNLIENSIKFRRDDEVPAIHIGILPSDEKEWHFFVKDNGIGIDPKYFPKLFVIFKRLHTHGKYAGTGVGLAMCKKIMELHGGRIWVESKLRDGSTFHFTLPRAQ